MYVPPVFRASRMARSSSFSHFLGKSVFFFLCIVVLSLCIAVVSPVSADYVYPGGDGTANDPYQISTSDDVRHLSTDSGNWDKHFILTNTIPLSAGSPANTIGNLALPFTGSFDGQGFTISNFTMNTGGSDHIGIFGILGSIGKITNLTVHAGAAGVRGNSYVGVLIGYNAGSLTNCHATGNVTAATDHAGGLVGANGGSITNCNASGNAVADNNVGGLVGKNQGTVTYCSATGDAAADNNAGGLVEIGRTSRERV